MWYNRKANEKNEQKRIIFTIVLLVLVFIISYGLYATLLMPKEGEVISKSFTPASESIRDGTRVWNAERYNITIKTVENGKTLYGFYTVDSVIFHEIKIGDWYDSVCMCVKER